MFNSEKQKKLISMLDGEIFPLLEGILFKECQLIISDEKNFIICPKDKNNPAWIWTKNNCPIDTFIYIGSILKKLNLEFLNLRFILYNTIRIQNKQNKKGGFYNE